MLYAYQKPSSERTDKRTVNVDRLHNLTLNCRWHNEKQMTINDREKINEQVMKGLTRSAAKALCFLN